ncbi:MAG: lactate racemase domain-containing protein [Gemmataceae bacterium]|nr:lactate racemase domain-containing protein [Gemmataceae bacterium]
MKIGIDYGRERVELDVPDGVRIEARQPPPEPLSDPAAAVRAALETPHEYPALRQALTPDDHVAIIVDDRLPRVVELLTPILEHLVSAQVELAAVTVVCASSANQGWVDDLPEAFEEIHVEIHDAADRRKLSYLATTKHGRRLYLNRTVVDADQIVVLAARGYDPLLGYSGAEGAIYPAFSDEATRKEMHGRLSLTTPGDAHAPVRQEAAEAAWLMGAPFLVQIIPGAGDRIAHIVAGSLGSSSEGQRLLDARWRISVPEPVQTIIASLSGDPAWHDFADLARAAATAARAVQPGGRIVLLSRATPALGPGAALLRQTEDPGQALELLEKEPPLDRAAAVQWASAAQKARIYLLSGLPTETAEELYATPLERAEQVQRLLGRDGSVLLLPDAHHSLAVIAERG